MGFLPKKNSGCLNEGRFEGILLGRGIFENFLLGKTICYLTLPLKKLGGVPSKYFGHITWLLLQIDSDMGMSNDQCHVTQAGEGMVGTPPSFLRGNNVKNHNPRKHDVNPLKELIGCCVPAAVHHRDLAGGEVRGDAGRLAEEALSEEHLELCPSRSWSTKQHLCPCKTFVLVH